MLKNTTRSEIEREKIDKHVEIEKKWNPTKSEKSEKLLKTEKSINSEKFGNQNIKKTVHLSKLLYCLLLTIKLTQ